MKALAPCSLLGAPDPPVPLTRDRAPKVLLRALRDFNLGKLTSDDTSIFVGLLNDLFPKTLELVPRARELSFEAKVGAGVRGGGAPLERHARASRAREACTVRASGGQHDC